MSTVRLVAPDTVDVEISHRELDEMSRAVVAAMTGAEINWPIEIMKWASKKTGVRCVSLSVHDSNATASQVYRFRFESPVVEFDGFDADRFALETGDPR
jgi:hypothetical protein